MEERDKVITISFYNKATNDSVSSEVLIPGTILATKSSREIRAVFEKEVKDTVTKMLKPERINQLIKELK